MTVNKADTVAITLTDAAASRVKNFLEKDQGKQGLYLGVRKTGCSGWAYEVELSSRPDLECEVFSDKGVDIFVPKDALAFLDGTTVDFVREGINQIFKFENPNVTAECGCGESFTTN